MLRPGAAALVAAALALSCGQAPSPPAPDPIEPLHAFEEARREAADFAHLPPSDHALGPDPYAIRALPDGHFAGLLRGRDALVLLDASLREIARAPAPASPTGIAVIGDEIVVAGEASGRLGRYRIEGDAIHALPGVDLDARGLRDVAISTRAIYAVDARGDHLFTIPHRGPATSVPTCAGAFRVALAGEQILVDCLVAHTIAVFALDTQGIPAAAPRAFIRHDGPIWGFDAVDTPAGLLIAAGGVEDHPLDRREGSFGFIDSFVFVYRVPRAGAPERLAAVNTSEHGVITPKAVSIRALPGGGAAVIAAGYGADRLAEITWATGFTAPPAVVTRAILPGVASMAAAGDGLVFADPLFDMWFRMGDEPVPVPDAGAPTRSGA
jgi:hypothetical protein